MTRRLVLSYLALTFVVLAILVLPLGLSFAEQETDELITRVERDAFAIAGFAEETLEGDEVQDVQALADEYEERTGGRLVIVDAEGRAVADSDPPTPGERFFGTRPEFEEALTGVVATGTRSSETLGTDLVYVAVPIASGEEIYGAVRVTYPTSEVDERVRQNWFRLGLISLVSLLAAAVIGAAIARSVVAPVQRLQAATTDLGAGDLSARAPTGRGPPELRSLAKDFNDMAVRLEALVDAQESFVADASHQMRTPLTALRLRLENLEQEVGDEARPDVEAARLEVQRMSRMVDGLLALARAERSSTAATRTAFDLAELMVERQQAWEPVGEEHGVRVVAEVVPTPVLADADRVGQVVDNLLANAVDASTPGGTVTLACAPDGVGTAVLHVVDEGPGLSDEERQRAFDRFWRSGHEGGSLGGSGLGLSIVRKLVTLDGGDVELRDAPGHGLDATVTLPAS